MRRAYIVGAIKIPYAQRDTAHAVLTPEDDRGFYNIIGAEDGEGHDLPIGANVTYRVDLTDEEAARFREASNCRYVELDGIVHDAGGPMITPAASSMKFMRADFQRIEQFHGRDVLIGLLDGGTTTAVRNYLDATMVAKQTFGADQPGADEITSAHGCLVAGQLIPRGGRFLDAIVSNNDGSRAISASTAAARWCADQGAKVINYSGSGQSDNPAWADMLQYLKDRGVQFFAAAGNDSLATLNFPARYSTSFSNCHSSIAFDENTGTRASFSCHHADGSGCAPGSNVVGFTPAGVPTLTSGTSMSSPHMALLCAMGMTAGRYTAAQVGAALKANTRDTGQPASEQGHGAYSLEAALTALGAFSGLAPIAFRRNLSPNPSFEGNSLGYAIAARAGLTAAAIGRFNTIPAVAGTIYTSSNITGNGTTSATPDAELTAPTCAVTAGQAYVFSAHSRHAALTATVINMDLQVQWKNDAGAVLGTVVNVKAPVFNSVWGRYWLTAVAPTGATQAVLKLRAYGFTDATARSWRFDAFQYELGNVLAPYFDGSMGAWEGTVNNSTSTIGVVSTPGGGGTPPGGGGTPDPGQPDPGTPTTPEEPPPPPSRPVRVAVEELTALRGLKGKREWKFRYELLSAGNIRVRDLDNMLSGSIDNDFFAEIKRTGKFTLRDDGSINFLTQRIRPWAGIKMVDGTWKEWSLGVFLLTTPVKSVDISGAVVRDVEAYDQTMVLVDDTVPSRYFVGANVEYTAAIQELLTNTPGIPSFSIESSTTRTPAPMEWEPGTTKLRIISDLLAAINYASVWFDGNGTLRAGPYIAPSQREPDFLYQTDDVSVILPDAEQNLDLFQIPNRWVLIVSNPDQPPLRAEITNASPLSPTSTINRGRIITKVVTDVEAPNQAVLNSLAERLRDEDGQVFEHISFDTGLMPFHENGDVFDFIHYGLVVSGRFMETKWSLNLQQGAAMKHEARRTVSVLGGFGIGPFGLAPFGA